MVAVGGWSIVVEISMVGWGCTICGTTACPATVAEGDAAVTGGSSVALPGGEVMALLAVFGGWCTRSKDFSQQVTCLGCSWLSLNVSRRMLATISMSSLLIKP